MSGTLKLNGTTVIRESSGKIIYNMTPTTEPTSGSTGDFYLDTNGYFNVYQNGAFQKLINTNVGGSENNPFSSCADISNLYSSGIHSLWCDFGGNSGSIRVLVDYDTSGGPWIMVSFAFGVGGWNNYNDTFFMSAQTTSNGPTLSGRGSDTGDLGLGDGTLKVDEIFSDSLGVITDISTYGGVIINGVSSAMEINYYNHGENSLFSTAIKSDMQDWVRKLCPLIPHVAGETDSQGLTSADAWNDQNGPNSDSGHQLWIQDKDNAYMRATPKDNTTDESSSAYMWTENTYNEALFPAGAFSNMNTGISGLYNTKMILPENVLVTTGTGGGTWFGTPYVRNFKNSAGNIYNNRTYFLIRD